MLGARATFQCHTAPRQFTCLWLHRLIFRTYFRIFTVIFKTPSGSYVPREKTKIIIIIIIIDRNVEITSLSLCVFLFDVAQYGQVCVVCRLCALVLTETSGSTTAHVCHCEPSAAFLYTVVTAACSVNNYKTLFALIKLEKLPSIKDQGQNRGATGSWGSVDPHFFEYAVHMRRLTPHFCQLFRLRPPLFVTLRGLCSRSHRPRWPLTFGPDLSPRWAMVVVNNSVTGWRRTCFSAILDIYLLVWS